MDASRHLTSDSEGMAGDGDRAGSTAQAAAHIGQTDVTTKMSATFGPTNLATSCSVIPTGRPKTGPPGKAVPIHPRSREPYA
jgi:hypothetical protein